MLLFYVLASLWTLFSVLFWIRLDSWISIKQSETEEEKEEERGKKREGKRKRGKEEQLSLFEPLDSAIPEGGPAFEHLVTGTGKLPFLLK